MSTNHSATISSTSSTSRDDTGVEKTLAPPQSQWALSLPKSFSATVRAVVQHIVKHTGVGIVCAVAYFDPCVFPPRRPWTSYLVPWLMSDNLGSAIVSMG